MNVSVVGGGIVLLVIGAVAFGITYNRVSELQSFAGQFARYMSPSLQDEYVLDQMMEILFGLLAVGGLGLVIGGLVMKEKPGLSAQALSPNLSPLLGQSHSSPDFVTKCVGCGKDIPSGWEICQYCNAKQTASTKQESPSPSETTESSSPIKTQVSEDIYCIHCGVKNPGIATYCKKCGKKLA